MSKKKFYPKWKEIETTERPAGRKGYSIIYYDKKVSSMTICGHFGGVSHYAFVKNEEYDSFNGKIIDHFATPEECRERKILDKETNPWIPGNEPDEADAYEVTTVEDEVTADEFRSGNWGHMRTNDVIAYKKLKLSEPYKPKRELRCPCCDGLDCELFLRFLYGGGKNER